MIEIMEIYEAEIDELPIFGYCINTNGNIITLYNRFLNQFFEVFESNITKELSFIEYLEKSERLLTRRTTRDYIFRVDCIKKNR